MDTNALLEKVAPLASKVRTPEPFSLETVKATVAQTLAPAAATIDAQGIYPREFMQQLGHLGGFGQTVTPAFGGQGQGFRSAIQVIETVSQACLCTGFITWCHIACVWYTQNSENLALKQALLPAIATGTQFAATGLSNPMKHFAAIEKIALVAERRAGGYVINGLLPWVSNLGPGHVFAVAAQIAGTEDYLMAVVSDRIPGLTLKPTAHFIALEGSNTFSCQFRDVFVADEWVLAAPCADYIERIKSGFVLAQVGMGLGLVQACVESMERSNRRYGHVNGYLDDSYDAIAPDLERLRAQTYALADHLNGDSAPSSPGFFRQVVQARADASVLSLRAAQAAMLHAGARSYLLDSPEARRLREANFVAIVTPALKHLKKLLKTLPDAPTA
ncbi:MULTISPECIES: acyl-CoA dehydrogenase family protein [unclassified Leptolyngbya]|uniref:acyl-CoA dehydrogenase family protein n=1 Tax=unclassified Leptolyngbya TaxID=2650499 RepID=UPI001687383C|nr:MULTISPECIES: acyl-CoA dehydrogenase family protein [unclassified Leptolyngbya]MBD1910018.1 acyl-CoA/acyl-ACP dehydrogenase [Leptolyngbya sp. FACHB-8]MBD2156840.1 acyl-CoA/acyl-ACP dehydrogenase [Leptolyngbya sp. FACHB-16]